MRLLVILQGDVSKGVSDLSRQAVDYEDVPEILRYLTLTVPADQIGRRSRLAVTPRLGTAQPCAVFEPIASAT